MNPVIILLLALAAVIAAYPFARFFINRCILAAKLKKTCRRGGFGFRPARKFWLFGTRNGTQCDFHIEMNGSVLCVKLFDCFTPFAGPRRRLTLVLTENGKYCFRSIVPAGLVPASDDGRFRDLPDVDFASGLRTADGGSAAVPVLLVHPVCGEIRFRTGLSDRDAETILSPGDDYRGIRLFTASCLLKKLEAEAV